MTKSGGAHPAPTHAPVKKTSTRGRGAAAKKKAAAAHEDTDGDNDLEDAHGEIVMEGEAGLVDDVGATGQSPGRKTVAKGL